jgi:hypothetical protein
MTETIRVKKLQLGLLLDTLRGRGTLRPWNLTDKLAMLQYIFAYNA